MVNAYFQPVLFDTPIDLIDAGNTLKREMSFIVPKLTPGKHKLGIVLNTSLCNSLNSKLVKIDME